MTTMHVRSRHAASGASLALVAALATTPSHSQVIRQVTDSRTSDFRIAVTDDTGTDVFVASTADPFGTNPTHSFQIFRYAAATGTGVQVTTFTDGAYDGINDLSVSDDGQWLSFISRGNLTGANHDRSPELFTMARDGTSLTQVTNDPGPNAGAVVMTMMAGGGTKVAFASSSDPLASNPTHAQQIFLVNRNGTGLTQVTSFSDADFTYLSVSDDATKIAFSSDANPFGTNADGNYDLFAINGDGTGLRQLTQTTGADVYEDSIVWVQLAGGGSKIAFQSNRNITGGNADLNPEVFVVNWDGTSMRQLTNSTGPLVGDFRESDFPAITDDGVTVYFTSDQSTFTINPDGGYELWKIKTDGTGKTLLGNLNLHGQNLVVSGTGNRLVFDNDGTLQVIDTTATNLRSLLTSSTHTSDGSAISPDGTVMLFDSDADLTGSNPDGSTEMFRIGPGGTSVTQITNNVTVYGPTIGSDDTSVFFISDSNPTGGNPSLLSQVFKMNVDGTGISQLTSATSGFNAGPAVVSASDNVVVFSSTADLVGQNADGSGEIYRMNPDGSGLMQLSHGSSNTYYSYYPRVDAAGVWVVFSGNEDLTGGNADHSFETYRVQSNGTALQQLTSDPLYGSAGPDISPDGTKIAYSSMADPLGTNADHNFEIFLYDTTTASTRQITNAGEGLSYNPRFDPSGQFLYFESDSPLLESHHRTGHEMYRASVATGAIERVDGLGLGVAYLQVDTEGDAAAIGPNGKVVMSHRANVVGQNADKNREIFLIDTAPPAIRVSAGPAPTVVSWDALAGAVRYDVVRGDIHNLHAVGPNVDLGTVLCIEDDSADLDTAGNADPASPAPGQAFFYVLRGTQGVFSGPGSYGQGTGGKERVASAGDCSM